MPKIKWKSSLGREMEILSSILASMMVSTVREIKVKGFALYYQLYVRNGCEVARPPSRPIQRNLILTEEE